VAGAIATLGFEVAETVVWILAMARLRRTKESELVAVMRRGWAGDCGLAGGRSASSSG
jgi:RsiW-degrading membrane proteinase PrsW (M82 family)